MRKYVFAALMALCIAVPGTAIASPLSSIEMVCSPEINPQLVEAILKAAAEQTTWMYSELDALYKQGDLLIEKVGSTYVLSLADGGGVTTLMEDAI